MSIISGRDEATPTVLYMLTTGYLVDWSKVKARLLSHPSEARSRDRNGLTILHHSLLRRHAVPAAVLKCILSAHPEAVSLTTSTGQTPLSIACWRRAPVPVLKLLLDADPRASCVPDEKGLYPLAALWKSYRDSFPQKEGIWRQISLILCASYYGSTNVSAPQHRMLHAAAGTPWCPLPVLKIALNRHREQLQEQDELGRLPLAVAAASMTLMGKANSQMNGENVVDILLRAHPQAASSPDKSGRLPLFLAIEAGRPWDAGMRSLLRATPDVLNECDELTGLLPFMYAASSSRAPIDVVYELLRESPHSIQ